MEILSESNVNDDLIENTLKFYSIYLSKITLANNSKIFDKISFIYDFNPEETATNKNSGNGKTFKPLGHQLCDLLIKQFDKHCMNEQFNTLKLSIYNLFITQ